MKGKLSEIKAALTRKLGPLPVWAWALIAGAAIFVYRSRRGGAANVPAAVSPDITDQTAGLKDPLTLQPGESAYDPNTGQLTTAPGDPGAATSTNPLIPVQPGQTYYDPGTGELVNVPGGTDTATDSGGKTGAGQSKKGKPPKRTPLRLAKVRLSQGKNSKRQNKFLRGRGYSQGQINHAKAKHTILGAPKGKRDHKPKTQHQPGKTTQRPHSGGGGHKQARSSAIVRNPIHAVTARFGASSGRGRGMASASKAAPRTPAHPKPAPSMRQRPAAPRVVHPATQRVQAHPAKSPPPAAKRRRKR
jgi:hypothetical protein